MAKNAHTILCMQYPLPYFIATPPYRGWQRSEGRLLLHSFLSLDMFVAFSILRFGTSVKSVSWVGLTHFNRTWRTRRCSVMRRTCPSQLHLLSRAFITTFTVRFRASSWMVLPRLSLPWLQIDQTNPPVSKQNILLSSW